MLGVVPLPGVMLEALDDASGLSLSDVASLASSLPCLDYLVIIAHYVGLVGGADSFVIDCCLINALSSGVSSHSQISSCPLLSIFLKVFKAMMSYPQQSYFTWFSEVCQVSSEKRFATLVKIAWKNTYKKNVLSVSFFFRLVVVIVRVLHHLYYLTIS